MLAYPKYAFNNLHIHEEVEQAFSEKCIDQSEKEHVKKAYPTGLYTPNLFIRIGLFVLTVIIVIFTTGLFALVFLSSAGEKEFGTLALFFGLLAYGALEFMTQKRQHFRSGVDDALAWISAAMFLGGLNLIGNVSVLGNCVLVFLVCAYMALRFADSLMSTLAVLAILGVIFFAYIKLGDYAKASAPFVVMAAAAGLYLLVKKQTQKKSSRPYSNCLLMVEITSLLCFYLAGNYYVVREASIEMFNLHLRAGEGIPLNMFFWFFTIAVPLVYITLGVARKDAVLLRLGLLLGIAAVFTIRYYYAALPLETAMTLGGILLIGISYALIRYLKKPRYGFTYTEPAVKTMMDKFQVESLVIVESFGDTPQPVAPDVRFGGGSGGGGGASGEF